MDKVSDKINMLIDLLCALNFSYSPAMFQEYFTNWFVSTFFLGSWGGKKVQKHG